MSKKYSQLRFSPKLNSYIIEPIQNNMDCTKIHNEVSKIKDNIWTCTDKKKLEHYHETLKSDLKLKAELDFKLKLKQIDERTLVIR